MKYTLQRTSKRDFINDVIFLIFLDSSLQNNDQYAEAIRIFGVESVFSVHNSTENKTNYAQGN